MASFERPTDSAIPPSPWVTRFSEVIKPGGRILDVAAGHGRHSRFLASQGFVLTAVDVDVTGLADLSPSQIEILERDLEAEPWPFDAESFDGIVITNYLHRPLFPYLVASLAPDGVLMIETFGAGNEKLGRPRNPDFLLKPGELLDAFSESLQIVAYEHGVEHKPRPAVRQRLCALKAKEPVVL